MITQRSSGSDSVKLPNCVVDGVLPECKKAKVTSGHCDLFERFTADVNYVDDTQHRSDLIESHFIVWLQG